MTAGETTERIRTMNAKQARLAAQIRALGERHSRWTSEDRAEWNRLNAAYDAAKADDDHGRNRIGRDDARIEDGPVHADVFRNPNSDYDGDAAQAGTVDRAVAGWIRNHAGLPVPRDEAEAGEQIGNVVGASGLSIPLPRCRPTPGAKLSFSPRAALSTNDPALGGATVPQGFLPRLEVAMKTTAPMMQVAEIMVTDDGRELSWPTLDDTSNEGVQVGEGAQSDEDDLAFGAWNLKAYKYTSKIIRASHELLRDSAVNLAGEIGDALGQRLGRIVNRRATTGDGGATMLGIVNGSTAGKTAASATAIAFDELIELQMSVDPMFREGADVAFMMHSDVASYVRRLKDGDGRYIWQDSTMAGQPPLLLGAPVLFNQTMDATIASGAKTVLFGKLSMYKLRLVGAVRLRQLVERYAEYDQVGFIGFLEADGFLMKPSTDDTLAPVRHLLQP